MKSAKANFDSLVELEASKLLDVSSSAMLDDRNERMFYHSIYNWMVWIQCVSGSV